MHEPHLSDVLFTDMSKEDLKTLTAAELGTNLLSKALGEVLCRLTFLSEACLQLPEGSSNCSHA